jgi:hypothetical protein
MIAGGAGRRETKPRIALLSLALLAVLGLALTLASRSEAASPYEPNDSIPAAAGPLELGHTYSAALETPTDKDFFYFYVTSPRQPEAMLTAQNLGGGSKVADIDVTILDSTFTPIAAQAYIGKGETRVIAASLEPGKYFVEVAPNQGFGDAYNLSAGGEAGAFGTYAQIAGRCARAIGMVDAGETKLEKAKAKLQRATARLRRSRYGTRAAREKSRVAHRKAKARVSTKRRALREARESQEPWCSLAP